MARMMLNSPQRKGISGRISLGVVWPFALASGYAQAESSLAGELLPSNLLSNRLRYLEFQVVQSAREEVVGRFDPDSIAWGPALRW